MYDLQFDLPNGIPYMLSPHCMYAKHNWDTFGILHVTDIHINERNDLFAGMFNQLGMSDAAQHYTNFQDAFRDFIRYANKLHKEGLADVVLATGDLVDYVAEKTDSGAEVNNSARFASCSSASRSTTVTSPARS